jgi:bifunctional DNA-binding transcriptional regulator/antitoxin component of YhaV-PrlF toxin-antitoxin module
MSERPNMVTTVGDLRRRWDIFAPWFERLGIRENTPVEIIQEADHFSIRPVPQTELRARLQEMNASAAVKEQIIANAFDTPAPEVGPRGAD